MLHVARKAGQIALMALVASIVWSASASAQTREFIGKVDRVSEKKVIVDNRKGDKVSFSQAGRDHASRASKTKWEDLKKNDWVTVALEDDRQPAQGLQGDRDAAPRGSRRRRRVGATPSRLERGSLREQGAPLPLRPPFVASTRLSDRFCRMAARRRFARINSSATGAT